MARRIETNGDKPKASSRFVKKKTGTATTKKHRFQPFSERVSKLNIDAVRRKQARTAFADDDESHFLSALESWKDRNLSETFVGFSQRVEPFCQNLPQVIHYEDDIVRLLHEYLQIGDALSLEAFLELTAKIAHDLGPRFEKHFGSTVQIISDLAGTHADVAVIEWSFTCLAWLFKYLSRLLVPDLRPLFDLMSPLLGKKTSTKSFVSRFAAESMSYLIRKASTSHAKTTSPLDLIVQHAFNDLSATDAVQQIQYKQGLATLFADAIKGVERGVSSGAPVIMYSVMRYMLGLDVSDQVESPVRSVVEAMTIDVIHHTNAVGFAPILEVIIDCVSSSDVRSAPAACTSLLYAAIGTRKGTRIRNWSPTLNLILELFSTIASGEPTIKPLATPSLLAASTVAMHYAPFDILIPFSQELMRRFETSSWQPYFVDFCNMFVESAVDRERFNSLILPSLQTFVIGRWETCEKQLCLVLPRIVIEKSTANGFRLPDDWQAKINASFSGLSAGDKHEESTTTPIDKTLQILNAYVDVLEVSQVNLATREALKRTISDALSRSLTKDDDTGSPHQAFLLSRASRLLVSSEMASDLYDETLSNVLNTAARHSRRPGYLFTIHELLSRNSTGLLSYHDFSTTTLASALIENLASSSAELRRLGLDIWTDICKSSLSQPLHIAKAIQDLEPTIQNLRTMSLNVRKLGSTFAAAAPDLLTLRASVAFCFGLLHVRLTPIWDDVCRALQDMRVVPGVEEAIVARAADWLQGDVTPSLAPPSRETDGSNKLEMVFSHTVPGFECSNLTKLDDIFDKSQMSSSDTDVHLSRKLQLETCELPIKDSSNRLQALLLFKQLPDLAEKKSRHFVPTLLDWALDRDDESRDHDESLQDSITLSDNQSRKWSRSEQKALLALFSQFINPSVLYRSKDVYQALLSLLCNGDADIQRAALKAILTWKDPSVKPYETNLLNILDDARFREEITTFISGEESDGIRSEHKPKLLPVLLRLLYGRVVTRSGTGGSRGTQETRRKAVFASLAKLGQSAIEIFIGIALDGLHGQQESQSTGDMLAEVDQRSQAVAPRKLYGALRMLRDMLETLSNHLLASSERIALAVMKCLTDVYERERHKDEVEASDQSSLTKGIRQEGLVCMNMLFATCSSGGWIDRIKNDLFERAITPRLSNLPIETAQAPSIMLKIFSTWSSNLDTVDLLWDVEPSIMARIADCLNVPSAKDEVRSFILREIVDNVLSRATDAPNSAVPIILQEGSAELLSQHITNMLEREISKECLDCAVHTLINLQPFVVSNSGAKHSLGSSLRLLTLPSRRLNPRMKGDILSLIERLLSRVDISEDEALFDKALQTIAGLFSYFQDVTNRHALTCVFRDIVKQQPSLVPIAKICTALNANSSSRVDEPDYDARDRAFAGISELARMGGTPQAWTPILHNLLFFIKDNEEIATRSGAAVALRQFVQISATSSDDSQDFKSLIDDTLIPALQKGMKEQSELVRAEFVAVLAELVKADWYSVMGMQSLLGTDEETSFFNNILHIQSHRRARALHRLAAEAGNITSLNLSRFCLPLVENFFVDVTESSQNLAQEAVHALESVAQNLEWHRYRALLQRLMQDSTAFTTKLKVRTLGAVVSGLHQAHVKRQMLDSSDQKTNGEEVFVLPALSRTLPTSEALSKSLAEGVLTKLMDVIHFQDESTLDIRVLLALVAVRIVLVFPDAEVDRRLPAVLMEVCNILKSRAQEARDSARKTLADISSHIGPKYFGFIIKQLRIALKRGGQLHVLAYTVHSLIVSAEPSFGSGSLDYCLSDIVSIVMDATFGHVGHEKEAQGYINSMKEFRKKTVGFDSMELLATMTSLPHVSKMLKPIQGQLDQHKPRVEKVDEMLRRIREGLRRNKLVQGQDFLTLCYEVLKDTVQPQGQTKPSLRSTKMTAFAFELLRRVLDKHEGLKTASNLEGFTSMLDAALKTDDEEVQMAGMRFLSSIIKVPLKGLDEQSGSYIRIAKRVIEGSSSVHTPNAQAALRLVSSVLRERPGAVIKKAHFESDIAFLISKIKPDLEEPASQGERDKQVAAFNFLKAVLGRGVFMKEVYEVMDTVREVMVTSSATPIPDLARSVYSRFVLDYFPEEGKGLSRQLDFMTSNLQFEQHRGRRSVMEVMMFLLNKRSAQAVQPILVTFFLPLVLVLIVDDSPDCRDSALLLIRKVFERADKERTKAFTAQLNAWIQDDADPMWKSAALRVWALYLAVHLDAGDKARTVAKAAMKVIDEAADPLDAAPLPLLHALDNYHSLASDHPTLALTADKADVWNAISRQLEREDTSIRIAAARLVSTYLTDFAENATFSSQQLPLTGSHGLKLETSTLKLLISSHMTLLSSTEPLEPTLLERIIQNLSFLARLCTDSSTDLLAEIMDPLAATLRRESDSTRTPPYAKLACARLLSVLLGTLSIAALHAHLQPLLTPLHYLTTAPIPTSMHPNFSTISTELSTLCTELLSTFQEKLGPERYVKEMGEVQRTVRERREERGRKRVFEKVSEPERAERERKKRREGDKGRRQRKSAVNEGRRRGW